MKDNAEMILASLPHGPVSYLTPGEVEQTAAMLLSETPLARAWDYWLTRAGFGGV
jgi:HCOMODA/2-hydroxy-3-carboxy-muconic semialdehyde decarboxylase